ncbi:MAG TPA: cytochrome c biogenesis protein CcdA [Armatimonadota bacterium]|jgi:cytochrome c-type biogenesis protein
MTTTLSAAGIVWAFGAGLASFVSPCTLPLVPSYLSFITGASLSDLKGSEGARGRAVRHSLAFVLGFSLVFTLLGLGASALGQGIREIQPYITKGGGILLVLMGLHYMRVIRIPFLDLEKKAHLSAKPSGYLGSLAVGVVFSAGYSPCVGPWLASLLLLAAGSTSLGAVVLLATYCVGFGVPFVLAALALDRFMAYSAVLKRNMTAILRVSGALLLLAGVGMYTNLLTRLIPSQGAVFTKASAVTPVSQATFDQEVLKSDLPVLVDFSATWCLPCREMAPRVEKVAKLYAGELKVVTMDFDQNRSLAQKYGVQGLPSLLVFKGGKSTGAPVQGVLPLETLAKTVADRAGLQSRPVGELPGG